MAADAIVCYRVKVSGIVQGVGFRPFVYRLALLLALDGWVRNDATGVEILAQGTKKNISLLVKKLKEEAPMLARVDQIEAWLQKTMIARRGFQIIASSQNQKLAMTIGPDAAICKDCLRELCDPADRRWRYPLINCTHCGPRYTVTYRLPYDREVTSMAAFPQCADCLAEYLNPMSRRFHAEANACPVCGPQLTDGIAKGDPITRTLDHLMMGKIVAIKGLGGFHLACCADQPEAVQQLRLRKKRDQKPFALMVANLASARGLANINDDQVKWLESAERPIVLLDRRKFLAAIAPGLDEFGVMLPYTPLQYLLFHEYAGRPNGISWLQTPLDLVLVMTSANLGGEPLVIDNHQAEESLSEIADHFLFHDRDIVCRCDDSVVRVVGSQDDSHLHLIRRARGFVPRAISLAQPGPSVLALGAYLKNTICLTREREAFLSPHIGDLDNAASRLALCETVERMQQLLATEIKIFAHDRHPDFFSTELAQSLAGERPCIAVGHHHAHIAAVLAEHGYEEPVTALALDGIGLGDDGGLWGGELLHVDGAYCQRIGHLRLVPLPGGDLAARQPWRMSVAILHQLGLCEKISQRFADPAATMISHMLDQDLNCPQTSSLGRYFDAAAGLLGICHINSYEGQAAIVLETLAKSYLKQQGSIMPLVGGWHIDEQMVVDLSPLFQALVELGDGTKEGYISVTTQAYGAALFHVTLNAALKDWLARAFQLGFPRTVVANGGCMHNTWLLQGLTNFAQETTTRVLLARNVPPNDGGISLGQAWVARKIYS